MHGAVRTVWGRYKPLCGFDCQLLMSKQQFRGVRTCYKARPCQKEAIRTASSITSSGAPETLEDLYDARTMQKRAKEKANPSNPDRTGDPGMG